MPAACDAYLRTHRSRHLAELLEFLRIPSISTLSEHRGDIRRAAEWVANRLSEAGLEHVEILETGGHPVVYGDWLHAAGAPTALVYGHYDVQPVDPLNLWETPPFEPSERDGKLYARGATDDKGQAFMHIKAVEALMRENGRLPVNVRFIVEGEEEIGSPNLMRFVGEHKELLRADLVVISDGDMFGPGRPSIQYGVRGLVALEIKVRTARGDLHSGLYGGMVPNANHALVMLLDSLRAADGKILVPGFYDQVRPLDDPERAAMAELGYNLESLKAAAGVSDEFGEPGFTLLERNWARPTLEINGMWGGFLGEGTKTVIPCVAHAKITCRLVPDQEPATVSRLVEEHLRRHAPRGAEVKVSGGHSARPSMTPLDLPAMRAAAEALRRAWGVEPVFTRSGGSIPVVETFDTALGLKTIFLGFGLATENLHAPNEHFHLENFDTGLRALCEFYGLLST